MTVSKRQFDVLNAMEIPLWVSKKFSTKHAAQTTSDLASSASEFKAQSFNKNQEQTEQQQQQQQQHQAPTDTIAKVELSALISQPLFSDILMTFGVPISAITVENNTVNLGLFRWQFCLTGKLDFTDNLLITPCLAQLEKSSTLKRQLWQLIIDKSLVCH